MTLKALCLGVGVEAVHLGMFAQTFGVIICLFHNSRL